MIAKSSIQPLTWNCFNRLSRALGLPVDFQCRRELPHITRLSKPAITS